MLKPPSQFGKELLSPEVPPLSLVFVNNIKTKGLRAQECATNVKTRDLEIHYFDLGSFCFDMDAGSGSVRM
jgi:hypothetical protein